MNKKPHSIHPFSPQLIWSQLTPVSVLLVRSPCPDTCLCPGRGSGGSAGSAGLIGTWARRDHLEMGWELESQLALRRERLLGRRGECGQPEGQGEGEESALEVRSSGNN